MKRIAYFLCAMAVCAVAVSCQKDEDPSLEVNTNSVTFPAKATTPVEFEVLTNKAWTASCDEDWVTITPASGKGSSSAQTLSVMTAENEGNTSRIANITITADLLQKVVVVNQAAAAVALELSETPVNFTDLGGAVSFKLKSNYDWTVSTEAEWLTIDTPSGAASSEFQNVSVTAARNLGEARTASLKVVSGDVESTVEVSQTAVVYAAFAVTPASVDVAAAATSAEIAVAAGADVAWTVSASEGASVNPASGKGEGKITVSFAANTVVEPKAYTVTVSTDDVVETPSQSVTINQAAADPEPEVGDYYFSDGTFGKTIAAGKTPIAVIFYVGCATGKGDADANYFKKDGKTELGKVRAYAVALKNATSEDGSKLTYDFSDKGFGSVESGTSDSITDFLGYKNTNAINKFVLSYYDEGLAESNYPALYYTSVVFESATPAPAQSSGWFIPSLGQYQYIWDTFFKADKANSPLDALMSADGAGGAKMYGPNTSYWSSTPYGSDRSRMYAFMFNANYMVGKRDMDARQGCYYPNAVRPILVF